MTLNEIIKTLLVKHIDIECKRMQIWLIKSSMNGCVKRKLHVDI